MWDDDDEYFEREFSPEEGVLIAKFLALIGLLMLAVLAIYWSS